MPWVNEEYFYTKGVLRAIADWYKVIDSVLMIGDYQIVNRYAIALLKADFDLALSSIGKCKWEGITSYEFRDYKRYGKQQRVVIADMLGITDYELEGMGFYQVPQLSGRAYSRMLEFLNEKPFVRN